MNGMVSWKDYDGLGGGNFGAGSQQDIEELNKALNVGNAINPPGSAVPGDGFSMRVESLDSTLRSLTFRAEHFRLWRDLPKSAAMNTVEEHNVVSSFGENPDAGWMDEGELPSADDSTYERRFNVIRYIGVTRSVSHVATMIKPAHGPLIAQETVNGTMHILRILEKALFKGNNSLSPLQFDGYEKLMLDNAPSTHIIDLRGAPLSEEVLTDACLTAYDAPSYGQISRFYMNPKVKADLIKSWFPKERYDLFSKTSDGNVGLDIAGFTSPAGNVGFETDVFVDDGGAPTGVIGSAALIPATITESTLLAAAPNASSLFGAADAGDYTYQIQPVNRFGRQAALSPAAAVTVAAGDGVTIGVTPSGTPLPDWYEVYRSQPDGTALRQIARVPNSGGAGETVITDLNERLPFTTNVYGFQMNQESVGFKQLAPLVRIPLATIDTSIRWSQVLYGTPVLYTPAKNVLLINVGRQTDFVGAP